MPRTFENYTCNTHRNTTTEVRGQRKKASVPVYTGIPCAFWRSTTRVEDTVQSVGTILNRYEVNLDSVYIDVEINDTMEINWQTYNVNDKILHHNRLGMLDNIQLFISAVDNVT